MKRILLTLAALFIAHAAQAQTMPCASSPTPEATVACERERMGKEALKDPKNIVTFLRRVAAGLNEAGVDGGPFGILVKTGGHNCDGYSCDIICTGHGSAQKQWDVLVDAGGRSEPTWTGPLPEIAVRPCEIVSVAPQEREPKKPEPQQDLVTPAIRTVLEQIERSLAALSEQVWRLHDATPSRDSFVALVGEVQALRAAIKQLPTTQLVFPDYAGRVFGSPVTLRPVRK